ncbi:hypothetical protein SAMN04487888_109187 [Eubacterium callanderi]|uniref:hypothetical protein n=1 Tax=Eubacterium callanderi TaxID=53442 RepID=UPI0008E75025|nr:hypothetical protein [Eubacterium callanderi]SFP40010.1 hypothetical protein SAMN04487888_109187 [Eubacterium callanderi]
MVEKVINFLGNERFGLLAGGISLIGSIVALIQFFFASLSLTITLTIIALAIMLYLVALCSKYYVLYKSKCSDYEKLEINREALSVQHLENRDKIKELNHLIEKNLSIISQKELENNCLRASLDIAVSDLSVEDKYKLQTQLITKGVVPYEKPFLDNHSNN